MINYPSADVLHSLIYNYNISVTEIANSCQLIHYQRNRTLNTGCKTMVVRKNSKLYSVVPVSYVVYLLHFYIVFYHDHL